LQDEKVNARNNNAVAKYAAFFMIDKFFVVKINGLFDNRKNLFSILPVNVS